MENVNWFEPVNENGNFAEISSKVKKEKMSLSPQGGDSKK